MVQHSPAQAPSHQRLRRPGSFGRTVDGICRGMERSVAHPFNWSTKSATKVTETGFQDVQKTVSYHTLFGTISLYRGHTPPAE
jgi:hypothetical protein